MSGADAPVVIRQYADHTDRTLTVLRPGGAEDGLFQAREILSLRLAADLVTLSACDTGSDTVHVQEGVASLFRPFLAEMLNRAVAHLNQLASVA